jgi:hypothetical protein
MKTHLTALFTALALICAHANAANSEPPIAVYRWPIKHENVDAFADWLGRPVVWGEDFAGNESWNNVADPVWWFENWSPWVKAKAGRRLLFGVPIVPGPTDGSGPPSGDIDVKKSVSLEAGARGEYNHHYKTLAESLVAHGLGNTILRLGWEFNGGWYTWTAKDKPEAFAEYWRQIVKTMRAVPGAENLKFCWNPSLGYQALPAEKAWPGDEFVDFIGIDIYDESWNQDTYPWPADATPADIEARHKKVWNDVMLQGDHGLLFWKKFAAEHRKPLAFPEWGVNNRDDKHGGLDDAYFVEQMHAFIADPANNVAFHCYFDVQAPDGHHQLSPGKDGSEKTEFPEAAANFRALFGAAK